MPTASVSFTGLSNIRSARFALSRGVTPSSGTLCILPKDNLDITGGTLTYSYGGTQVSLTNCALAGAYIRRNFDGKWPVMALTVLDRRWTWAGKIISGDWNRRQADGTVDPATQKTPAELATLLLQALGESGFDTSRMPASVKPRALWRSGRADLALAALCESVACEVVYNHQTDKIEIWPLGTGITTPTNSGERLPKFRFVPRAYVPSLIQVLGGPSVFQHRLKLSPVVRNYSNSKQVKPFSGGWDALTATQLTTESPFSFPGISSTNNRIGAFEQLYRDFRVVGQADGTLQPPNCPTPVSSIDQYLLNDYLLETETDLEGYKRNLPCYLDGDYYAYTDLPTNTSSARYTGSFALSKDRRLVNLPYPLFKLSSAGAFAESALYLTTSYSVLDNTNSLVTIKRQGNVGGSGGTLVLKRPELYAIYSSTTTPGQQTNTEAQANAEADAYVALFQQKYANPLASEISYPGISAATCDGNIAQVTWYVSAIDKPQTTVCEQEELEVTAPSYYERRRKEQLAQIMEAR